MKLDVDGLTVYFPYDFVYPEQLEYMSNLKKAIDARGHALLEMPTGTGKTVCLISLVTSYQFAHPEAGKLIYCTRTVPEMGKCMQEIRKVIDYRSAQVGGAGQVLALCLSSRRNMCIHTDVMEDSDRDAVDSLCRDMTASWVRKRAGAGRFASDEPSEQTAGDMDIEDIGNASAALGAASGAANRPNDSIMGRNGVKLCKFYEKYDSEGTVSDIPSGIYALDDLKVLGRRKGWCPYFLARQLLNHANIVVYNYQYLLDPKISNMVSRELQGDSIVVFDEGHNIDNICIEALSVTLNRRALDASVRCISKLQAKVLEMKVSDIERLTNEYRNLVNGLAEDGIISSGPDSVLANPVLPEDILQEAVPGNIRKAEHFVTFLKKIVDHFRRRLKGQNVEIETPNAFVFDMTSKTALEAKPLRFTYSRLNSLLRTLEITSLEEFNPLQDLANFATLVSTYADGFSIVMEPNGSIVAGVNEPLLQLCCLDASIAIKPVLQKFRSVVITSGTLSPIDFYPKILNFHPVIRASLPMSVFRPCLLPLVVTKGSDQAAISTRFELRKDVSVLRNYGQLLLQTVASVPDGVCCFFTSYGYMEYIVGQWDKMGILQRVTEHKLIFFETKDVVETTLALDNYKRACDCGRGAVFLSVARGKVAEGIDFDRHYGRCVILFGIPYQYTLSPVLRSRLDFVNANYQIRDNDFLNFDALRQAAQCIGRVIRSKTDYGLVILADSKYNRHDKRSKLPPWINQFMKDYHLNLSTDVAVEQMKTFLKQMGQPIDREELHSILMTEEQAKKWSISDSTMATGPAELSLSSSAFREWVAGGNGCTVKGDSSANTK